MRGEDGCSDTFENNFGKSVPKKRAKDRKIFKQKNPKHLSTIDK